MKIRGAESLPEIRDAGPVAVRRETNDPAAAGYGAAAAIEARSGDQLARGMQGIAAGIEKLAADRTKAGVLAAYNDYVSRSSALLYDPKTGLMHAKGAGAEGLSGRAYEAHKALKDEIISALPRSQRKYFMEQTASYDRDVGASCMKREGDQMAVYRQQEGERTLKTIYTAAALNPEGFSMEAQEDAIREITIARYGDQGPEANLKNSGLVRSEFFIGMISQVAQKDPLRAEGLLKEYGGYIEPAEAQALKAGVEKAAMPVRAQAFAEDMLKKHGLDGLSVALDEVRKNYSGKDEDVYLSYVNSLFADARAERDARRSALKEDFYKLYNGKSRFGAVRDFINRNRAALGEEGYASYMNLAERMWEVGKYAPKPAAVQMTADQLVKAQEVYNEAKAYAMSEEQPSPADINLRFGKDLYGVFGNNKALASVLKLTAPKAGGADDKRGLYNSNDIVRRKAEDAGVLKSAQAYLDFDEEWVAACASRSKDEKRPLTRREMVEEGDKLIEEKVVLGRDGLFSGGPLKAPEYQFRKLGIRAEDVHWNAKTREYFTEKNGEVFVLEPDKDFYKLSPLKGDKRNFAPAKQ